MFLFNLNGFASELEGMALDDSGTTSTFTVKIPRKISLAKSDSGYLEGVYSLEVKNFSSSDDTYLVVEPDKKFDMSTYLKKNIEVAINQKETIFSNSLQTDLTKGHTTIGYITSNEPLSSGNWQGSFSFTISIHKTEGVATPSNASMVDETLATEVPIFEDEFPEDIILEETVYMATPSNASISIEAVEKKSESETEIIETDAVEIIKDE